MAISPTSPDRHGETQGGFVTTVQLPASAAKRRNFLTALQAGLDSAQTLGALPTGPSADVFVIPKAAEDHLRRTPGRASDAGWEAQLKSWGALTVNTITSNVLLALMRRGAAVPDAAQTIPVKLSAPAGAPQPMPAPAASTLPGDFRGPYDWHLDAGGANVVKAWEMFSADPQFRGALPWAGIQVGHIDTGYTEHAALGWANGQSSTVNPVAGYDYWDGAQGPDPRDELLPGFPGHGTRISGAIAGFFATAAAQPYYGAAPGVAIVPYRVTDSVIIDHVTHHVAAAIREAVDDGCKVINISLGALFGRSVLSKALDYAYENGVITVCAAGNVWQEVIYPGRYNRCITMGGVGPGMKPWSGSAHGKFVDLCAPADAIRRIKVQALPPGTAATGMEPKADGDGTSYATALCSGVAALWLAWHGVDKLRQHYQGGGLWQIPKAYKTLLRQTAVVPARWQPSEYGSGVINAAALLAAPLPADGSMVPALPAADPYDPND